jgi:serine palmitoyltransferase
MGKGSLTKDSTAQNFQLPTSESSGDHFTSSAMKVEQQERLVNNKQRYVSKRREDDPGWKEEEPPYYFLFTTYLSYLVLICFGHLRDFFGKRFLSKNYQHLKEQNVSLLYLKDLNFFFF